MFERFTKEARAVVSVAVAEAGALGHDGVGTAHGFIQAQWECLGGEGCPYSAKSAQQH